MYGRFQYFQNGNSFQSVAARPGDGVSAEEIAHRRATVAGRFWEGGKRERKINYAETIDSPTAGKSLDGDVYSYINSDYKKEMRQ